MSAASTTITAEARREAEIKGKHLDEEAQHEQRDIDEADDLPAAKPGLTTPTQGLQC